MLKMLRNTKTFMWIKIVVSFRLVNDWKRVQMDVPRFTCSLHSLLITKKKMRISHQKSMHAVKILPYTVNNRKLLSYDISVVKSSMNGDRDLISCFCTGLKAHFLSCRNILLIQHFVFQYLLIERNRILHADLFSHLWAAASNGLLRSVFIRWWSAVIAEVHFIANDSKDAVSTGAVRQCQELVLQLHQALQAVHVIRQDDGGCSSAVHWSQAMKLLPAWQRFKCNIR